MDGKKESARAHLYEFASGRRVLLKRFPPRANVSARDKREQEEAQKDHQSFGRDVKHMIIMRDFEQGEQQELKKQEPHMDVEQVFWNVAFSHVEPLKVKGTNGRQTSGTAKFRQESEIFCGHFSFQTCGTEWYMASKRSYSLQTYIAWGSFGFLVGVLLHAATPLDSVAIWIPLVIFVVGCLIPHRIAALVIVACAIGLWRFDATLPNDADDLGRMKGDTVEMIGRVRSVRSYNAVLDVRSANGGSVHSRSYVSFSSQGRWIGVGEEWRVTCRLEKNEKSEMRYQLWDARKGIFYTCKGSTSIKNLAYAKPWDVMAILAKWRERMSQRINNILPGDEGALLAGILYGERGLSAQANEAFRFAGMTHLIAVSGSNIILVVSLFVPFLLFLGYRRKSAIVLSGAGILLFTLFVGAEASVVRAAIMGWLAILARVFGRKPNVTHLLLLAGTAMILFDPWALAFDAGFALSFLATWGLIAWTEPITKMIRWVPNVVSLREIVATTTAATFVTAPYLLWAFEEVSLAGLVTNLVAIPLVGFAMAWGAVAVVFGDLLSQTVLPAIGSLRAMLVIANVANEFPFLKITYHLPTCGLLLMYVLLYAFWRLRTAKNKDYPQRDVENAKKPTVIGSFVRPC